MPTKVIARTALPDYLQRALDAGSIRETCPGCDGGTTREQSLSIRTKEGEDGIVTLKCYRSTCGFFAVTLLDGTAQFSQKNVKQARVYRDPLVPIAGTMAVGILMADYGLKEGAWMRHGWALNEDQTQLVMPILDAYGRLRGHQTRTLYEKDKRVYTWKATSQPFLDWWFDPQNSAPVVVVEDTLSACRLSGLGYNAVALLGTSISREDAKEIAYQRADRPVYLALDRDAFDKAIKLRDRHKHILPIQKVICLDEDIKNISDDDDIREKLDGRDASMRGRL